MTSNPDRTSRLTRRRRRRERIAGAALAVLGVAVLVVAVSAIQQQHDRGVAAGTRLPSSSPSSSLLPHHTATSSKPKSTRPRSSSTASSAAAARLPLVVLNNTTIAGLAQSAASRFEAGGWTVTTYDNYQNDIISTCAYYDPATARARDAALALQRQFPTIKRVAPQFSELSAWHSPIVVILTPDYSP